MSDLFKGWDSGQAESEGHTEEEIQDIVGAMLTGNTETNITVTYQDDDGTIDFEITDEVLQDIIGAMLTGNTETGITVTYQDDDGTIDFVVDTEYIEDLIGAMFSSNTETGITATYQDADGTVDLVLNSEWLQDLVGAMFSGNTETGITATYQDGDGTIDLEVTASGGNMINVVDDYSANNAGTARADQQIQNAINAAADNDIVYFPGGTYNIEATITIPSGKTVPLLSGSPFLA
jgi:hypothetical protein